MTADRPRFRAADPSSVLAAVSERQLDELLEHARPRRYEAGATVFREGRPSNSVVLLETGRVKVVTLSKEGREVLLAIRGPGDVIGELGALDGRARSATVTALDDLETLTVPASAFRAMLARDGRLALRLFGTITRRLRDADRKRLEFGSLDTSTRLALRLLEMVHRFGEPGDDGIDITLRLTQEELAQWVGASKKAVTKALGEFRDRGLITTGRRRITVLDRAALEEYVERAGV